MHAIKDIRWIVHSPCYVTRETHQQLLSRIALEHPLQMLTKKTLRHWVRKLPQGSKLSSNDVLHQRWLCLKESPSQVILWLCFCVLMQEQTSDEELMDQVRILRKNLPQDAFEEAKSSYAHILALFPTTDLESPSYYGQWF